MGKQEKMPLLRAEAEAEGKGAVPQPAARRDAPMQPRPPGRAIEWAADSLHLDFAKATKTRRRSFLLRLLIFVGLPTLLSILYVYVYATPRYVSEIQVVYQSSSPTSSQAGGMLSTFLGSSAGGLDMTRVIDSYVTSDTLLKGLDAKLDLHRHYSNPRIDFMDRLSSKATEEDFLAYFNNRVKVTVMMGGYDVIDVEAFDPKTATLLAKSMADNIDAMVEDLTERQRRDEMNFANTELTRTETALLTAKLKTTQFQNAHREFDPLATATQLETTVVGGLETQLSQARAMLSSRRQVLSENSPTIKSIESQISALDLQIATERTRLASGGTADANGASKSGAPYSDLVSQYTILTQDEQFAVDAYNSAKQAYELARANAQSKQNYVEAFVKANTPQKSTSPDPVTTIMATFVLSLLCYAGVSLLVSSFRDQAGV